MGAAHQARPFSARPTRPTDAPGADHCDDLAAAKEFYSRVLGLDVFSEVEGRHVFLRCGQGVFLLFNPQATCQSSNPVPAHGAQGPGHVAFAMMPAEIPVWQEHLQRQGVTIEAQVTWPRGGHSIYFRDPAGNSVELTTPSTWGLQPAE